MGTGVAVAADDGHTRVREAKLGADHVNDSLFRGVDVEEANTEVPAIFLQSFNLLAGDGIKNGRAARLRWNIMIDSCDCAQRLAHLSPGCA